MVVSYMKTALKLALVCALTLSIGAPSAQPDPFPAINIHVRRVRRRVWVRRLVRVLVLLVVLSALAWAGWIFRDELMRLARGRESS